MEINSSWQKLTYEQRFKFLQKFQQKVKNTQLELAEIIAKETGKPLWESKGEITGVINKIDISYQAYLERTSEKVFSTNPIYDY